MERAEPVAHVVRGGVVESAHLGHVIAQVTDGIAAVRLGDPDATVFARSSLKPVQAVAMLRAGLDVDGELLALACASHSGEPAHRDAARRILAGAGLTEADLQNTPDLPLNAEAAHAWRLGGDGPTPLTQNCSGKHAAMLATCVAAGWDTATYREPGHPLQKAVRATVAELTGAEPEHVAVDGCGAPLFSCTVAGLARAFALIAAAAPGTPEHRVATAVNAYPAFVGGTGRFVTDLIAAVPGLVAKDGAEGVFAAALPDGRAIALKIADGGPRAVAPVAVAALRALDVPVPDGIGHIPVLGHGEPVGEVRPTF